MPNYYQPEIECASASEIRAIQDEKLVKQVKHVYENVEYYRNLMDSLLSALDALYDKLSEVVSKKN